MSARTIETPCINVVESRRGVEPARKTARVMVAGSSNWADRNIAFDSLNAALMLLRTSVRGSVLVHGGGVGADQALAATALQLGMDTEIHVAYPTVHTEQCPDWDRSGALCQVAGARRYSEIVDSGIDICLVFPTHGYRLAPGEKPEGTSRDVWAAAEIAKLAHVPTIVIWGKEMFPFGDEAMKRFEEDAAPKSVRPGTQGQLPILDVWLPF